MSPFTRGQLRSRSRGFTMIELIVVMIIIAIAFCAVQPQFGRTLKASKDRAALREVIGALTTAHAKAVSDGRLVRLILAPGNGEMWAEVQMDQADPRADRSQFDPLPLLGRDHLDWPERLTISAMNIGGVEGTQMKDAVIYFYPDGRTSGAAFAFTAEGGQSFRVDLSPATGRVQISA